MNGKRMANHCVAWLAGLGCAAALGACSGGESACTPHVQTFCQESTLYWANGCGDLEDVIQMCPLGCNADHSGCEGGSGCTSDAQCGSGQVCYRQACCTPQCTGKCCGDNGCGGTCPDLCAASGQTCNNGSCRCEGACQTPTCPSMNKSCGSYADPCGGPDIFCGNCIDNARCNTNGQCECVASACGTTCCAAGQTCNNGACCTPLSSCGGRVCGTLPDNCGGTLSCGNCEANQSCSSAGQCVAGLPHFSFFVTSLRALRELSGSQNGFGGDLRYGETGPGAGLRGADKLCAAIAERSMPGASAKGWKAFLCAADDGSGNPVHAIDRIGNGPWYDRLGRLFANNKSELLNTRPINADPAIKNDFPNEDGVPNHNPDGTGQVDNHDMITGCNAQGRLYSATATCLSWESKLGNRTLEGRPRVGHSWPRTGPGGGDMANWISSLDESGCAPGVNLIETGAPGNDGTIGSGGGYGGFYCFADTP